MNKKPIYTEASEIGNLAVTYCQKLFEENHWIFHRADGTTDFGIDSEVEIVDANQVTGKIFKCQIKGTESIEWSNNLHTVSVKVSTWNYWKSLNLPVIALLVDISNKDIYWGFPLASIPEEGADTVSLRFVRENNLNLKESFSILKNIIETWLENFPDKNILRVVPFFYELYNNELKSMVDSGNPWVEIVEDLDFKTRLFYNHVLELRLSVGLTNEKIIPLEDWYIRNSGMWEGTYFLYHAIFSELMKYISPYYEEAMGQILKRIKTVEGNFENNEIINYFKLHPLFKDDRKKNVTIHFVHPLEKSNEFHARIEDELKKINALKISWFSRKNNYKQFQ